MWRLNVAFGTSNRHTAKVELKEYPSHPALSKLAIHCANFAASVGQRAPLESAYLVNTTRLLALFEKGSDLWKIGGIIGSLAGLEALRLEC